MNEPVPCPYCGVCYCGPYAAPLPQPGGYVMCRFCACIAVYDVDGPRRATTEEIEAFVAVPVYWDALRAMDLRRWTG